MGKRALVVVSVLAILGSVTPATGRMAALPGKAGGVLNLMVWEDPPVGLALHEATGIGIVWPAAPCFSNLVMFDPMDPVERVAEATGAGTGAVLARDAMIEVERPARQVPRMPRAVAERAVASGALAKIP